MGQKTLTPDAMKRGGRYNWKNQPDRLIYLSKLGSWHQFKKIGDPREVWCEVLDADLRMLEETADAECERTRQINMDRDRMWLDNGMPAGQSPVD